MTTIKEIESAIKKLSKADLSLLRRWFDEFDAKLWDKQFEKDASSGRLDKVAEKAVSDFKAGNYKEL